jgi:hypothetical protein
MAVTFKGAPALQALQAAPGRITLVNATEPDDELIIVSAVLMRHLDDGTARPEAAFGLDLEGGNNMAIDTVPTMERAPAGVEALLTLRIGAESLELYLTCEAAAGGSGRFELGLRRHDGEVDGDETLLPGHGDFAAWARRS